MKAEFCKSLVENLTYLFSSFLSVRLGLVKLGTGQPRRVRELQVKAPQGWLPLQGLSVRNKTNYPPFIQKIG